MPEAITQQQLEMLQQTASSSTFIRNALSSTLPCGKDQFVAIQVPGLVVSPRDYLWDDTKSKEKTAAVKCKEAALVDGMVPTSTIMLGRSGKSVARSYSAALDLLVPVEASVAGSLAQPQNEQQQNLSPEKQIMKTRYEEAMKYLTLEPEKDGMSRLEWYVQKQEIWSQAVAEWEKAKDNHRVAMQELYPKDIDEQQTKHLDWLQVHAREYKAKMQAKYMDWVVHGYKFGVEFNFGVVDISSGMKRVESSKEAFRNLGIIDPNGSTEWQEVRLTPSRWAEYAKYKMEDYDAQHKEPTRSEILFEIKRLESLIASHRGLQRAIKNGTFYARAINAGDPDTDAALSNSYQRLYERQNFRSKFVEGGLKSLKEGAGGGQPFADPPANMLVKENDKDISNPTNAKTTEEQIVAATKSLHETAYESASKGLVATRENVLVTEEAQRNKLADDLDTQITQIQGEINELKKMLGNNSLFPTKSELPVVDENGMPIDAADLKAGAEFKPASQNTVQLTEEQKKRKEGVDAWTRISVKVEVQDQKSHKIAEESASHVASAVNWFFASAEASASHSASSSAAAEQVSNCSVSITFDALLVEIDRPWLHAELFADQELDIGKGFTLSPGPDQLKEQILSGSSIDPKYTTFPSYPTAFVLASNVELEFTGSTSKLESQIHASKLDANVQVGYGPFSLSASHKQSRSEASTKMESTSTGLKISLRAPQIIAWVSTILPALPRPEVSIAAAAGRIVAMPKDLKQDSKIPNGPL